MSQTTLIDRQGSHAGRGFRYQDAIAVWLAVRAWAGLDSNAVIIPEGGDDIERRAAAGNTLIQVKSRREHLGALPLGNAKNYVKELWDRHDRQSDVPIGLDLVVEQGIVAHEIGDNGPISIGTRLASTLPKGVRGRELSAKTRLIHAASPTEATIKLIAEQTGCSPLAAQICVAQLQTVVGSLADQNGRLTPDRYRGLSGSDTDAIITSTLAAVDSDQIEQALRDGACEPVDFLTPLDDSDFYLGVDVQPGHVVAGLVVSRIEARNALARGLEARGAALIAGPSGSGKSAIMWDLAFALRHTVRWYRLARLDQRDIPALRQLMRTLRAKQDSPVGLVVDDVGRRGAEAWDALTREFATISGALLVGSIREEDLFLLEGRSRAVEVRAEADASLAERLFEELRHRGRTGWAGWKEPWHLSQGLVLEYVHILSAGRRFEETLAEQVDARQRDPNRSAELTVLRVVAFGGAAGAAMDSARLAPALGLPADEAARALRRLVDEHLLREGEGGRLTGLHQLRSAELLRLTHAHPPPAMAKTFEQAVLAVETAGLESLVADAMRAWDIDASTAVSALSARIEIEPDIEALASMLRGLGTARIANAVEQWLVTDSVGALPRTQIGSAGMFGVTGVDVPDIDKLALVTAAAAELAAIKNESGNDPRMMLLDNVPADHIAAIVANEPDAGGLNRLLSALVGIPLHDKVRTALKATAIDLLATPLNVVVMLLGTVAEIDRDTAIAWVDRAGPEALVARMTTELPWAWPSAYEDAADGNLIRCDYSYIYESIQPDPHEAVVRICEVALALSPRSDIAASTARAPNGAIAGSSMLALADKRIARSNLPSAALPTWNRRWLDAIAQRVATPSYTEYLVRSADMLDRLVPALDQMFDAILRGEAMPEATIMVLNQLNDEAESLTPPAVAVSDVTGSGSSEPNTAVTKLQNLLFSASVNLVSRFAPLPEGVGSYVGWLTDLIEQADDAEANEPWSLIDGPPANLLRLRDMLVALRAIAGESEREGVRPTQTWVGVARGARPRNALRLVGTSARARMASARTRLGADLTDELGAQGITAEIHVREDVKATIPWPPTEVLALLPAADFVEAARAMETQAQSISDALPDLIRLTVIPVVDGHAVPELGRAGHGSLLPLPDVANDWMENIEIPAFHSTVSASFDRACALASARQSMDRLERGREGRPTQEREALDQVQLAYSEERITVEQAVEVLGSALVAEALNVLDRIRNGTLPFADEIHNLLNGGTIAALREVAAVRLLLAQAELDVEIGNHAGDA